MEVSSGDIVTDCIDSLWTTGLAQQAEVRSLVDLIEARDRIKFKDKEHIFQT